MINLHSQWVNKKRRSIKNVGKKKANYAFQVDVLEQLVTRIKKTYYDHVWSAQLPYRVKLDEENQDPQQSVRRLCETYHGFCE